MQETRGAGEEADLVGDLQNPGEPPADEAATQIDSLARSRLKGKEKVGEPYELVALFHGTSSSRSVVNEPDNASRDAETAREPLGAVAPKILVPPESIPVPSSVGGGAELRHPDLNSEDPAADLNTHRGPVVSIDATHLTGSLKGVLLIASAKDGDSKIYPLAFGFAASECKGSWTWFLSELKKGIGSPQDLVIVSDRHRGIISAMNEVFPYAQHAFCVFHIAQKFRRSSKNQSLAREFFYNACYQHRRDDCDIDLQQMAACNQRYYNDVMKIGQVYTRALYLAGLESSPPRFESWLGVYMEVFPPYVWVLSHLRVGVLSPYGSYVSEPCL
ncbi:hypothetical protein LWI29_035514 [Acer saccharum]|uniref:MULE transposase domain-containing protein n=1 Tax=Acer saccharum TaxID=4024 RepID=A0AA39RFY2_ACESA|nr:hypothetical protein LWI29_035514 [Acer saccharum]